MLIGIRVIILQRKLLQNGKTLVGMACPNFKEKTFIGFKTAKFVNIFSLESFPLYGIYVAIKVGQ